ncbi:MAG: S-layer homology domain-containing protein, partial [Syntrophomonas sp.]
RAEFATMLVKAFQLSPAGGKVFDDTANHWARDNISTAAAHGILNGYGQNLCGPDDLITREQMAVMIVKAAGFKQNAGGKNFADASQISSWAREAVAISAEKQIINGYPDNTFQPLNSASRAEAATVIVKSWEIGVIR